MSDAHERARAAVDGARDTLLALSRRIHAHPEVRWAEFRASAWLGDELAARGFAVERGICDLPTAFEARFGRGELHIVICAEYDALPRIGHACGHNIIAATAVGAGIALAAVADRLDLTVRVIGTPAEEGGGGKVLMLQRGAFAGAHLAMMTHPGPTDVVEWPIIASERLVVRYTGKEAHASAYPEQGINAADAMTVASVALGLIRQHLRPADRIHGYISHGGEAPNVIPAHTEAIYVIRARTLAELDALRVKVLRCFEAGAIATGCEMSVDHPHPTYAEMRHDPVLAAAYRRNAEALGRRFDVDHSPAAVSTDMGNVSHVIPSIHPCIGIESLPAANHQIEFADKCIAEPADRAILQGAVALAWTAVDCAEDPALRAHFLSLDRDSQSP